MYVAAPQMLAGIPILLGSWWGLLTMPAVLPVLIWRLLDEERFLDMNLPGYRAYQDKVRYPLFPPVWQERHGLAPASPQERGQSGDAELGCGRVDWFAMYLGACVVDDDNRQLSVSNPGIVTEPARQLPAMFDRSTESGKFQPRSVSGRSAVLHAEIIGSHALSCASFFRRLGKRSASASATDGWPAGSIIRRGQAGQDYRRRFPVDCRSNRPFWLALEARSCQTAQILPSAAQTHRQFGLLLGLFLGILSTSSGSARSISRRAIRRISVAVVRPRLSASIAAVSTFRARPSRLLKIAITVSCQRCEMKNPTFLAELHKKLGAPSSEAMESLRLLKAFLKLGPRQRFELIEMAERLASNASVDSDHPVS
jgi:hypothetical protein